jgi:hypothetical protein
MLTRLAHLIGKERPMVDTRMIDKSRIVGTLYDDYVKAIYTTPEPMQDWQEVQIRAAFYAGVFGILAFIEDNAEDEDAVTDDDISLMTSIHTELAAEQKTIVKRMEKYWNKEPTQ